MVTTKVSTVLPVFGTNQTGLRLDGIRASARNAMGIFERFATPASPSSSRFKRGYSAFIRDLAADSCFLQVSSIL